MPAPLVDDRADVVRQRQWQVLVRLVIAVGLWNCRIVVRHCVGLATGVRLRCRCRLLVTLVGWLLVAIFPGGVALGRRARWRLLACDDLVWCLGVGNVLVGHFLPERSHDHVTREVFDGLARRCVGDEVHIAHLGQFLEDEVTAAVAVQKRGHRSLGGQPGDGVGDVRPLDGDGVFDTVFEQPKHVRPPLDDDDGVAIGNAWPGRIALVLRDVLDAGAPADLLDHLFGGLDGLVERRQQVFGALDQRTPLCLPNVFEFCHFDGRSAGTDPFDSFEGGGENRRLDAV